MKNCLEQFDSLSEYLPEVYEEEVIKRNSFSPNFVLFEMSEVEFNPQALVKLANSVPSTLWPFKRRFILFKYGIKYPSNEHHSPNDRQLLFQRSLKLFFVFKIA